MSRHLRQRRSTCHLGNCYTRRPRTSRNVSLPLSVRDCSSVLSVVGTVIVLVAAAVVASSGLAAATQQATGQTVSYGELDDRQFWQGQTLSVTGLQPESRYELRRATGGNGSDFTYARGTDGDGRLHLDIDELDGRYFLRGPGITDDRAAVFEVDEQTLRASWSRRSVRLGQSSELELDSNRNEYTVAVSAGGLQFEELERIFEERDFAPNHDARADDDELLLSVRTDDPLSARFSNVDSGTYSFTAEVVDTNVTATATVSVGLARADAEFVDSTVLEDAGDVANTTVTVTNTETAYLVVGDRDSGFVDVVELTDDSGDGRVTVEMNTRYVGLDPDEPGVPSSVRAYRAENPRDSVEALDASEELASGRSLGSVRSDLGVGTGLAAPAEPADYPLVAASSSDIVVSDGRLRIRDERDAGTLVLSAPRLRGIETLAAPSGGAGSGDVGTVRELPATDTVAIGDRLVVRVSVSGVYGHLRAEHDGGIDGVVDNEAEGIDLVVEQTEGSANREPITVALDGPGVRLAVDEPRNELYVVVDTRTAEASRELAPGQSYEARFELRGVDEREEEYSVRRSQRARTGFPYLDPGQERIAETSFELVERRASVDGEDGGLTVEPVSDARLSGTANLAPGSTLRVRSTTTSGPTRSQTTSATVRANGSWTTRQDFSGAGGRPITVTVSDSEGTLTRVDGRVRGADSTPTPTVGEPTATSTTATPTPGATTTPTATAPSTGGGTLTGTPSGPGTTTAVDGPGFGVGAAVIALLAATLLARRRQ